jgi:hypothetical protein
MDLFRPGRLRNNTLSPPAAHIIDTYHLCHLLMFVLQ